MTGGSCAIVCVLHSKTKKAFSEMENKVSRQTKAAQQQVQRIVFIQALFPMLVLIVPMAVLPIVAMFKINNSLFGKFESLTKTSPLFNSITVILCIPSYRRIFLRVLKNRPVPTSVIDSYISHRTI
ncbi:unnamed protein product [Bursaphelenchus okinawaensis]|uniref:G_PROTEIN_RECEP_F1_2 domain-containing protein n=1 Tax=Bursaphelenchus okinawaensis TaxID=465554 RepID=A0A811KYG3_9BILA|nr:unnamed protein product [Bursaphelenchus okinawaensis]CAG9113904.1 unnamed protein product [Bursaphelenchus okinawaensis]